MTHSRMSDSCAEAIARSVASDPPLRELQLAGNALSVQGVGALMVALERNTHLRKLGLNGNALQDADVEPIVEYLESTTERGTPPLHSLSLKGNALTVDMQQRIMQASASCSPAVRLDLRHQVPARGERPPQMDTPRDSCTKNTRNTCAVGEWMRQPLQWGLLCRSL